MHLLKVSAHVRTRHRDMFQQYVAAANSRDLLWGHVGSSSNKIKCVHTGNCSGDILQGHVTVTRSLMCAESFWHVQHKFLQHVVWSLTSWIPCNMSQGQNSCKVHVCVVHAKNYQHTRGGLSLEHVPLHFLACVHNVILLLLHVPASRPLSVNNTLLCRCYMSLQLVPATCPHVCRDLKTNVLPVFWYW